MSKFKVGDKVRVTYGRAFGTVGIIKRYTDDGTFVMKANEKPNHSYYEDEGDDWCFHSADYLVELVIEHPRREFIVIRRSGAETIAELRHDREVIKSGKAICNTSDTFDFDTGAKLAFDRLMGREEPKRESLADVFAKLEKPAPKPAHRFKVGDRVVTKRGNGTILLTDETTHNGCILVAVDDYVCGHNGFPWTEDAEISKDRRDCMWESEENVSPAPAPEPPKKYMFPLNEEQPEKILHEMREVARQTREKEEPPKFYTGKVVMVDCEFPDRKHLINHLFEFKDGRQVGNKVHGMSFVFAPYKSFEQIVSDHNASTWIEVKSDV